MITIPSPDPAYDLGVVALGAYPTGISARRAEKVRAIVFGTVQGEALFSVIDLDEMSSGMIYERSNRDDFTVEKRFHLIPAAQLLITIPYSNDQVVLRRLDIDRALRQTRGAK
jgi:hypothetical protein